MYAFCYLNRDWAEGYDDIFYVCNSSTSGRRFLTSASWNGARLTCSVVTRMNDSGGRISGGLITGVEVKVKGKGMDFMIIICHGC